MIFTEAQTLDEALEVLVDCQRYRAPHKSTLRRELALNKLRQKMRPITLSDRTVAKTIRGKEKFQRETVVWTREQVVTAYASGHFKLAELAWRAKVKVAVIKEWVWG